MTGRTSDESDGALFLRMGLDPMNADELAGPFPPLPVRWWRTASTSRPSGFQRVHPPGRPAHRRNPRRRSRQSGPGAPLAIDLLRSVLEGLDLLFAGAEILHWRDRVRAALDQPGAAETADAYLRLSGGSASERSTTLTISLFNGHPVTEAQEPWINELLNTSSRSACWPPGPSRMAEPRHGCP